MPAAARAVGRASKAGNRRARKALIELAWLWLRHQPESAGSSHHRGAFMFGDMPREYRDARNGLGDGDETVSGPRGGLGACGGEYLSAPDAGCWTDPG